MWWVWRYRGGREGGREGGGEGGGGGREGGGREGERGRENYNLKVCSLNSPPAMYCKQ